MHSCFLTFAQFFSGSDDDCGSLLGSEKFHIKSYEFHETTSWFCLKGFARVTEEKGYFLELIYQEVSGRIKSVKK